MIQSLRYRVAIANMRSNPSKQIQSDPSSGAVADSQLLGLAPNY